MAYAKNIGSDRGLTWRMMMTGLFLVILWGIITAILFAIGLSFAFILVIMFAGIFCQYWFSDRIALFGMGGRLVTPQEAPQLHAMVDRLCLMADMPKHRVAIAQTDMPNAFATGRSPKAAVVCVTTGIQSRLSDEELNTFTEQLGGVLEHANDMNSLDLSALEPTSNPFGLTNVTREDIIWKSLDRAAVLAEAPDAQDGRFAVPRILGEAP